MLAPLATLGEAAAATWAEAAAAATPQAPINPAQAARKGADFAMCCHSEKAGAGLSIRKEFAVHNNATAKRFCKRLFHE
jgi:hypothetical protein